MTQYVPMIIAALGIAMIFMIFKSKSKGTDIIDAIRDRKIVLQEALLVFLAVLEGLIAADVAFSENMNYWVRLSAHMAIAAISVIFGSTLYRQFQELYASIKLKQSFWMVFKELTDVFMSAMWTVLPAFANTWFIVMGRKTQAQAVDFLTALFNFKFTDALLALSDGTTFMSMFILSAHVFLPIYLGLFAQVNESVDNVLKPKVDNTKVEITPAQTKPAVENDDDDDNEVEEKDIKKNTGTIRSMRQILKR